MKILFGFLLLIIVSISSSAQFKSNLSADKWVDSVFKTLNDDQKIAQLIVVRLSAVDLAARKVIFYGKEVEDAVRTYGHSVKCSWAGMRPDAFLLVKQDHPPDWHATVKERALPFSSRCDLRFERFRLTD